MDVPCPKRDCLGHANNKSSSCFLSQSYRRVFPTRFLRGAKFSERLLTLIGMHVGDGTLEIYECVHCGTEVYFLKFPEGQRGEVIKRLGDSAEAEDA